MWLKARIKSLIYHNYWLQKQRNLTNRKNYTYDSHLHTHTHTHTHTLHLQSLVLTLQSTQTARNFCCFKRVRYLKCYTVFVRRFLPWTTQSLIRNKSERNIITETIHPPFAVYNSICTSQLLAVGKLNLTVRGQTFYSGVVRPSYRFSKTFYLWRDMCKEYCVYWLWSIHNALPAARATQQRID